MARYRCWLYTGAVNVSTYQILHESSTIVRETLNKTGLDPRCDIGNNKYHAGCRKTGAIISVLKSFDVKVAIDDFRTGYSTIGLLRTLNLIF